MMLAWMQRNRDEKTAAYIRVLERENAALREVYCEAKRLALGPDHPVTRAVMRARARLRDFKH